MNKNVERFIRYAKIDTQADENTGILDTQKLIHKPMKIPVLHHQQKSKRTFLDF